MNSSLTNLNNEGKYCILFPVEIVPRELNYKLLLAIKLASLGYKCYLGEKAEIWRLFSLLNNFAYLDKGYDKIVSRQHIYEKVTRNKGLIFHLDDEGGVDFEGSPTLIRRYSDDVFNFSSKIFLWGKNQDEIIKRNCAVYEEKKIVISGHPRFQLLLPPYDEIHAENSDKLRKKYGDYILFNLNTKYSNHIRGELFLRNNYGKRVANLSDRIAYDSTKLTYNVDLIKALSEQTKYIIIIRPHPEENIEYYKELFSAVKNVFAVYDDDVIPWIMACKFMIHNDCTTAIESAIAGKIPLAFNTNISSTLSAPGPLQVSKKFDNINSIIAHINKDLPTHASAKESVLEDSFSVHLDSLNIIVSQIDGHIKKVIGKKATSTLFHPIKYKITSYIRKIIYRAYRFIRSNRLINKLGTNKLIGLDDKALVYKKYQRLVHVDSTKSIKISNPRPKLYVIEK